MKKWNFIKTLTAVCIILVMLIQLVSCNNKKEVEKEVLDHVYRRTEIAIPDKMQSVNSMYFDGQRINMIGTGYNEEDYTQFYIVYSVNQDGSDPIEKKLNLDFSKMEGYDGSYLSNITVLQDGRLLAVVEACVSDKMTGEYKSDNFLIVMDDVGKIQKKINIKEMLKDFITTDYFYVGMITADSEGNLYLSSDRTIFVINSDFTFFFKVDMEENSWMNRMFNFDGGKVAAAINAETPEGYKMQIRIIDPETKGFTNEVTVNEHLQNNIYNIFSGQDYSLYYSTQSGIYGYDIKNNESRELLDWINSDIENPNINMITAISDKKFVCVGYEYDDSTWTSRNFLLLLDYIPPEEVVPKYLITLATAYGSYDIRKAVIEFNRNSQEYRIQIKDYYDQEEYVDYNKIMEKLNNDIIAGNMPDILLVNSEMPFDSYVSKGLFYDLYKLMEKDENFNKEDYFTNVLDVLSVNGKLYSISPSFTVNTVAIKSKFVNPGATGWTMGELQALLTKLPPETVTFLSENRAGVMNIAMNLSLGQFIDKDTGKCYFDSQDFIDILKFAKTFDEKSFWDNIDYENLPPDFWDKYNKSYEEDRAILNYMTLSSFYQLTDMRDYTFKDDITFIGFPNSKREGSAISVYSRIAISSKSKLINGSWEFVKTFLSDKYQESLKYEWPLKISAFDKMGQKAIKGEDNGGIIRPLKEEYNDIMPYPTPEVSRITEEDVKYIKSFIQRVTTLQTYEPGVLEIIEEEAKMYYAGNKTAEETARIIQSRVQIYISESR
ncbi:MAG: extracellular solute-binding protein [Clostridiaceae bacterium]|nr:extracellular solute-binding protein [Clostridiaceae bacterium]